MAGLTEGQLLSLADFEHSTAFNEIQQLALRYSLALTQTPVVVPEALFAQLQRHFTNHQLVELTSAIAWENYWSRFNHAFGVEAEESGAGAVCLIRTQAKSGV
jgi:alkylhydroperoxidase family enzyme